MGEIKPNQGINYSRIDSFAKYRTHLANEKTFLAYLRTLFAFMILAAVLIKLFPSSSLIVLASLAVIMSLVFFIYGFMHYSNWRKKINQT